MNDLYFENQILQAEVAALRSELTEATEKHRKALGENRSLSRQLGEMRPFKTWATTLEEQNRNLNLELTKLKTEQAETETFRSRISHLENELRILKETDTQMKIVRLKEVVANQDKIVAEFTRKLQRERKANERLKIENRSLSARLSSSNLNWQRVKWKIVSTCLAGFLLISTFTSVWLLIR